MFKMVTGGNGRSVYCGVLTGVKDGYIKLTGTDWNFDLKSEEEKTLIMKIDSEILEKNKNLEEGQAVVVTMMPSRNNPNQGVAEEIAQLGEIVQINSDRGANKLVGLVRMGNKRWNDAKSVMSFSIMNPTNISSGQKMGVEVTNNGRTTHWLNITAFPENPAFRNRYNANYVDENFNKLDVICFVATVKDSVYNGKPRTNYNLTKIVRVHNPAGAEANNESYQTSPYIPEIGRDPEKPTEKPMDTPFTGANGYSEDTENSSGMGTPWNQDQDEFMPTPFDDSNPFAETPTEEADPFGGAPAFNADDDLPWA